jgi:hypothetical protein
VNVDEARRVLISSSNGYNEEVILCNGVCCAKWTPLTYSVLMSECCDSFDILCFDEVVPPRNAVFSQQLFFFFNTEDISY